jgi:hypothetical protein
MLKKKLRAEPGAMERRVPPGMKFDSRGKKLIAVDPRSVRKPSRKETSQKQKKQADRSAMAIG